MPSRVIYVISSSSQDLGVDTKPTNLAVLDNKRNRILTFIAFFLDLGIMVIAPSEEVSSLVLTVFAAGLLSSGGLVLFRRRCGNNVMLLGVVAAFVLVAVMRGNIASGPLWLLLLAWIFFASEAKRYRLTIGVTFLFIGVTSVASLAIRSDVRSASADSIILFVFFILAFAVAQSERFRIAYIKEVSARQQQQEAERKAEAERHAQESRTHIARELHDIVAHSVSVMVVQARGARQLDHLSPKAASAFKIIEDSGRESLKNLRQVLTTLRPHETPTDVGEPLPSFKDLKPLVNGISTPTLETSLMTQGDIHLVSKGMQLAVYRIIQESLTNVVRHARASKVAVRLVMVDDTITTEVIDNGSGFEEKSFQSEGYGLQGMKERTALYDGELSFNVTSNGGLHVTAKFKVDFV